MTPDARLTGEDGENDRVQIHAREIALTAIIHPFYYSSSAIAVRSKLAASFC